VIPAENVESAQMLDFVRSSGFDSAQGRFFTEPVAAARDFDAATTTLRTLPSRPADGESSV